MNSTAITHVSVATQQILGSWLSKVLNVCTEEDFLSDLQSHSSALTMIILYIVFLLLINSFFESGTKDENFVIFI